jgi:hypothetical protein
MSDITGLKCGAEQETGQIPYESNDGNFVNFPFYSQFLDALEAFTCIQGVIMRVNYYSNIAVIIMGRQSSSV